MRTLSLALIVASALGGCASSSDSGGAVAPMTTETQVKQIDQSAEMSPEAKAAAAAQIEAAKQKGKMMMQPGARPGG